MKKQKAEMSTEVIIAMIIGLIVLVVLLVIFGKTSLNEQNQTQGIADKLTCKGNGGTCVIGNSCDQPLKKKSYFCGLDSICCGPAIQPTSATP